MPIAIFDDDMVLPASKRSRGNPPGEDCFLRADGTVVRDEDKIIRAQQIWKEAVYAPGGVMFLKAMADYRSNF